jgi:hypothetical protein
VSNSTPTRPVPSRPEGTGTRTGTGANGADAPSGKPPGARADAPRSGMPATVHRRGSCRSS